MPEERPGPGFPDGSVPPGQHGRAVGHGRAAGRAGRTAGPGGYGGEVPYAGCMAPYRHGDTLPTGRSKTGEQLPIGNSCILKSRPHQPHTVSVILPPKSLSVKK